MRLKVSRARSGLHGSGVGSDGVVRTSSLGRSCEAQWAESLQECLERELALAADTIVSPDFAEGVRCTMIDKQDEPQWSPATVSEVDVEAIRRVLDQPGQLRTRP